MSSFTWHVPHMLAAYMDFGVGILIAAHLWGHWLRQIPSFWNLLGGGVFALLPDFDIVVPILRGDIGFDHHQLWTHFPAFMIPIGGVLGYFLGGWRVALLGSICVTWHFIHDSPPLGGGIAWTWPLSREYFSLTGAHIPQPPIETIRGGIHALWGHANMFAAREILFGTLALSLAAVVLRSRFYMWLAGGIATCVWLAVAMLWYPQLFLRLGITLS